MFLPSQCGCCGPKCNRPYCTEELTQAVVSVSFPGGSGLQSTIYRSDGVQEVTISCQSGVDERIIDMGFPSCPAGFGHNAGRGSTITSSTLTTEAEVVQLPLLGGTLPMRRVGVAYAAPFSPGFTLSNAPSAYSETVGAEVNVILNGVEGQTALVTRYWRSSTDLAMLTLTDLYVNPFRDRLPPRYRFEITSQFGRGADLRVDMTQGEDGFGRPVWRVHGVTVVNGGNGYHTTDQITLVWENTFEGEAYVASRRIGFPDEGANAGKILSVTLGPTFIGGTVFRGATMFGLSGFRVQRTVLPPALTATCGSAVLEVFLNQRTVRSELYWGVQSLGIVTTACDIEDGQPVTFSVPADADHVVSIPAEAYASVSRIAPTITASAPAPGSGAAFAVTIGANGTDPQTWSVTGVEVTNGGSGYPAQGALALSLGTCGVEEQGAAVPFFCAREEPTVVASPTNSTQGNNAQFSVTLSEGTDWFSGLPYWYVSSVSVTDGGLGYEQDEPLEFTAADGEAGQAAYATANVDENGTITSVNISYGGSYYKSSGVIESVAVLSGGSYYRRQLDGFLIANQGAYVRRIYEELVSDPIPPARCRNVNPMTSWRKHEAEPVGARPAQFPFRYQDPSDNQTICLSPPVQGGCGAGGEAIGYPRCGLPSVAISMQ